MKPICPQCGSDAVRRISQHGAADRLFGLLRFRPFRCQLCTHRFRALARGRRHAKVDRRQYDRMTTQVRARILGKPAFEEDLITDLSMDGCRLKTKAPLTSGAFLHLRLRTSDHEPPITVQAAMVRSVYADSVGLEFIDLDARQKSLLSRFVQALLVSHSQTATKPAVASR